MNNILRKPFTNAQWFEFVDFMNSTGRTSYETDEAVFALLPNEIVNDEGEIVENPEWPSMQLQKRRQERMQEVFEKFAAAQNKPLPFSDYFLLAAWATTYVNTLMQAQRFMELGVKDDFPVLVIRRDGSFANIIISEIEDFMPMFDVVEKEDARLKSLRNLLIVEVQDAKTIEELEAVEIDYTMW